MIITFNGDHGSGKSTIAKRIAKKISYPHFYMGQVFRDMAREKGLSLEEFHKLCDESPEIDKLVDDHMVEIAKKNNDCVIESRTAWHFIPNSIKIYLKVSDQEGAKRIFLELKEENARNEGHNLDSEEKVLQSNIIRKAKDDKRYWDYYGINVREEKNYDLVLDTTNLNPDQVFEKVYAFLKKRLGL